jgi:hypothetical protein
VKKDSEKREEKPSSRDNDERKEAHGVSKGEMTHQ